MIIVEFCGTPGCGKSTLCAMLKRELLTRGYSVENLQEVYEPRTFQGKIERRINKLKYQYAFFNYKRRKMLSYMASKDDASGYWRQRILEAAYRIRQAEKKGIQIGLFDEGIIQFITSMYHEREFDNKVDKLIEDIDKNIYGDRVILVNCILDMDENYRRLKTRGRAGDRFLVGNDIDNKEALKAKKKKIDYIFEHMSNKKNIIIDMKNYEDIVEGLVCKIERCLGY